MRFFGDVLPRFETIRVDRRQLAALDIGVDDVDPSPIGFWLMRSVEWRGTGFVYAVKPDYPLQGHGYQPIAEGNERSDPPGKD